MARRCVGANALYDDDTKDDDADDDDDKVDNGGKQKFGRVATSMEKVHCRPVTAQYAWRQSPTWDIDQPSSGRVSRAVLFSLSD